MESNICMNGLCGATASSEWKRGWALKSGGYANLCYNCGIAYDNVLYCEKFHLNESGWRECKFCEKPIHCGCIVSKYLYDCQDIGGIACITCLRAMANRSVRSLQSCSDDIRNRVGPVTPPTNSRQSTAIESQINGASGDKGKLVQPSEAMEKHHPFPSTPSNNVDPALSVAQVTRESKVLPPNREVGTGFSSTETRNTFQLAAQKSTPAAQKSTPSSMFAKPDNSIPVSGLKGMNESLGQSSLTFSLGGPQGTSKSGMSNSGGARIGIVESNEPDKVPSFKQGQRTHHIQPKPPKPGSGSGSGSGSTVQSPPANKGTPQQTRVARPPPEGHGRNQLLPRYWPKITDQELEQIAGDLKSNIVPLFEKTLSASDAGRIGRLVLPKACAEAYFPLISNSEGLPIRIQDIKGKEWTFQFRFWPNNNSRMYVLEGVTPCIQTMQMEAGDTVIFSRKDPGNQLVIGCRKASNSVDTQEAEITNHPNGPSGQTSHAHANEITPVRMDYEGTNGHSVDRSSRVPEKKRSRNIGLKSKRMLMHSEDAMELRDTWKEAYGLLRPPPNAEPNVVMIENNEFEEYDEPPVFGKPTIFTKQASGEHEQWGQCDNCFKWRKLPLDVLLPPKWTCSDNTWDPNRSSCSVPDELSARDLERIFGVSKGFKRRRVTEKKTAEEQEPTGLDTLANVAVLGNLDEPSFGATTTTKHPRHRPGCTCIVCIQPPSGKGHHKDKDRCICNVCLTFKRRFKTLMIRKKKKQLEREAAAIAIAIAQGTDGPVPVQPKEGVAEVGSIVSTMVSVNKNNNNQSENGKDPGTEMGDASKGHLDLNCDPNREEELKLAEAENNGLATGIVTCVLSRAVSDTDELPPDNSHFSPMNGVDNGKKGDGA